MGPPRRRRKGGGDDGDEKASSMSGSAAPGKRQVRHSSGISAAARYSAVELPPLLNEVLQEKFVQRKRGDLRWVTDAREGKEQRAAREGKEARAAPALTDHNAAVSPRSHVKLTTNGGAAKP